MPTGGDYPRRRKPASTHPARSNTRKLAQSFIVLAIAGSGFAFSATPASADCIEYVQYELTYTDINGDGKKELVVYYPPIPSDTNPSHCVRGDQDVPLVVGSDIIQLS